MNEENQLVPTDELSTEISQIEKEIVDPASGYWRSPDRQARYGKLLEARQTGTPAPKADPRLSERLAIEKIMADPARRQEYWNSEAMQLRYRELLADSATPSGEEWRASPTQARAAIGPTLAEEWGERFAEKLRRVQDMAGLALGALDESGQTALKNAFDLLPRTIQENVFRELSRPEPGSVAPLSESDIAWFGQEKHGAGEILAVWGKSAPRKVAIALDRLERMEDGLTDPEKQNLKAWWDRRTPRERQMMLFTLGS